MPPQEWTHVAHREEVLAAFATFTFDFLDVAALIRGAEVIYQYPIVDRDPVPMWDFGRADGGEQKTVAGLPAGPAPLSLKHPKLMA